MATRLAHVACIMDGNGRWARRRGLPRTAGHTAGEEALANLVREAVKRDIGWLTVFGFSTENWVRPLSEVRHILGLHRKLFGRVEELKENDVRIRWIGRPFDEPGARTPANVQRAIRKAIADTSECSGMTLTVGRDRPRSVTQSPHDDESDRCRHLRAHVRARHATR
jgi:undecaprenyl diphosphate synthase